MKNKLSGKRGLLPKGDAKSDGVSPSGAVLQDKTKGNCITFSDEEARRKASTRPAAVNIIKGGNIARFNEEDEEDEGDDELDYTHDLFVRTVANIQNGYESGILTPENATNLQLQAIEDYRERLIAGLGYDPEEVDEYLESLDEEDEEELEAAYSSGGVNIAEFQAGNGFGSGLQLLLAEDGYEDLQEGVDDLATTLGLDPDEAAALLTGELVPSAELIAQIADIFDLNDDDYCELDALGEEARAEVGYEDEEESESSYSDYRVRALENKLAVAEFQSAIKDTLSELELSAREGVQEGWLPPVIYRELIGEFSLDSDRIATFSTLCEKSNVDAETMLFATNYAIEAFRRCGPFMNFSAIVDEPLSEREIAFEQSVNNQASLNHKLRLQRNKRAA